jgi:hypothetical protein
MNRRELRPSIGDQNILFWHRGSEELTTLIQRFAATVPHAVGEKGVKPAVDLSKVFQSRGHGARVHRFIPFDGRTSIHHIGHTKKKILLNLRLQRQLQLLTPIFDQESPKIFHGLEVRRFKGIQRKQDAEEEDMRAEDQRRVIHNFRQRKVVAVHRLASDM